ncbi:MAG: hypothetical protein ACSHX5_04010 [Phycisphaerales bacterium]
MHKVLDGFIAKNEKAFTVKRAAVMTVDGRTIIAHMKTGMLQDEFFQADADEAVVVDAYRRTARIISPDIARTYTMERARRKPEAEEDIDDALIEAREDVAALHLMENLQVIFDAEAKAISDSWFDKYRDRIKALPHDRQEAYRQIIALSTDPQDVDLARPTSRFEPTKVREKDGTETAIATHERHLLCDEQDLYPAELLGWEQSVLESECKRKGFRFWYRNPDRPSQDSLGIAYVEDDDTRIVRPDFIFFAEVKGEIVADIVDPHGTHLADALPKLKGLARYAETHGQCFRRIEAIAEEGGKLRVLDLTRVDVRDAVSDAKMARSLFQGLLSNNYG